MIRTTGRTAAALLCLAIGACSDGSGTGPTTLPASVSIDAGARAETGAGVRFKTSLAQTQGVTFLWNFGDGATGTDAAPLHAFAKSGTYEIEVSMANSANDRRTASFTVTVGHFSNVQGLDCTAGDDAGWCWQDVNVTPHAIADLTLVAGTSQAWAVGDFGTIVGSTDGGDSWTPANSGVSANLWSVRFRDAAHGIALGEARDVLRTEDGGSTWTTGADMSDTPASIASYDASRIVVRALTSDYVPSTLVSQDEGATWANTGMYEPVVAGPDCWWISASFDVYRSSGCIGPATRMLAGRLAGGSADFTTVSFIDAAHGMALSYRGDAQGLTVNETWTTANGGKDWSVVPFASPHAPAYWSYTLQMADASHAFLFDGPGTAWITTDAGATWNIAVMWGGATGSTPHDDGHGVTALALWASNRDDLMITRDYSATWQTIPGPEAGLAGGAAPRVVQWTNANDVIVNCSGRVYVTHDAGATWKRVLGNDPRDAYAYFSDIWFSDATHGVMARSSGAVETTSDGGRTWTRKDYAAKSYVDRVDLWFASASDGWMLRDRSLWQSTDGGVTWSQAPVPAPMKETVASMSWNDASHGWAAAQPTCCDAVLYATLDGGRSWTTQAMPNDHGQVASVAFEDAKSGVVAMSDGGVLRTTDGGASWKPVSVPFAAMRVQHTGAHTFWAFGDWGSDTLLRSADDGATWSARTLPGGVYAAKMTALDDAHVWLASWNLRDMVLVSDDNGDTWATIDLPDDGYLTSLFALDGSTLWGVTGHGQVLATATGGR